LRRFARLGDAYRFVLEADLAINCPAYACRQLGRNVEAGKRQAASNATTVYRGPRVDSGWR
jgi:hypothetical protein